MPLSEEEQRILAQIEANLLASDPDLARHVGSGKMPADTKRRLQLAGLGFVIAVIASVLLLSVSFVLAFAAFLAAFGAVVYVHSDLRSLGKARLSQARSEFRSGIKDSMRDVDDHRGRDADNPFN